MPVQKDNFSINLQYDQRTAAKEYTNSRFTTDLATKITLNPTDHWEVGVQSINIDRHVDTVNNARCSAYVQFDFLDNTCLMGSINVLFNDHCSIFSHDELIKHLYFNAPSVVIKCPKERTCDHDPIAQSYVTSLQDMVDIRYEKTTGKFKFKQTENLKYVSLIQFKIKTIYGSSQLGQIFGVSPANQHSVHTTGLLSHDHLTWTYFDEPSQFLKAVSYIKVQCSIAGKGIGQNDSGHLGIFPYLSWINSCKGKSQNCSYFFKYPLFVPVRMFDFQHISVGFVRAFDTGEELVFSETSSVKTSLTLIFRKGALKG